MSKIKQEIKSFLKEKGLTLRSSAQTLGFQSPQALHYWLNKETKSRDFDVLERFNEMRKKW